MRRGARSGLLPRRRLASGSQECRAFPPGRHQPVRRPLARADGGAACGAQGSRHAGDLRAERGGAAILLHSTSIRPFTTNRRLPESWSSLPAAWSACAAGPTAGRLFGTASRRAGLATRRSSLRPEGLRWAAAVRSPGCRCSARSGRSPCAMEASRTSSPGTTSTNTESLRANEPEAGLRAAHGGDFSFTTGRTFPARPWPVAPGSWARSA